ncbi:MAG: NUDIX hydrolase [Vibrio sp.]
MHSWLSMAKELQAIAQAGEAYSQDGYDLERFDQVKRIAYQMIADLAGSSVTQVENLYLPETGYPTPKVDVRAGVICDGKILLVKEAQDGRWALPGGWGDVCETPTEGVIREVREESGLIVAHPRLVAIKDRAVHGYNPMLPYHIYKLFFLCEYQSGELTKSLETTDVQFFSPNDLPQLSSSRTLEEDINMLFTHGNQPDLPVYVD